MASDDVRATACGLFAWRPSWMQIFLSHKMFVLFYILMGVSQSMVFSYLTVVLSTIEKQFGVRSTEIAWIYSGNEISQICFVIFLPFVGRVKKRPLVMGLASIASACGMFLIAVPYLAGRGTEFIPVGATNTSTGVCSASNVLNDKCDGQSQKDWLSIAIIFIGIFTVGIGSTGIFSFGVPYLDDNSAKSNTPYALSFAMCSRVLGPALGYCLGAVTLKVFVKPGRTPEGLTEDNPLWIGAWWMGFVIVSSLLICIAPCMTLFPSIIPPPKGSHTDAEAVRKRLEEEEGPSTMKEWWQEFFGVARRLFTNKVFMFTLVSNTFTFLAIIGFAQFLPKYFEFVFRQRASTSALLGPLSNAGASIVGLLIGGLVVGKFQPRARLLGAWSVVVMILGVFAFIAITQIGCPSLEFYGKNSSETERILFNNLTCNSNCGCSSTQYKPICSTNGRTVFFSPCQAGCKSSEDIVVDKEKNKTIKYYSGCSCVTVSADNTGHAFANPWPASVWGAQNSLPPPTAPESVRLDDAFEGYCPSRCQRQFYILIGLMLAIGMISATSRLPNTLILLRAIEQRDKAAALTLTVSFVSAFALLPSPIIYGSIFDGACTIWGEKCGETLNCLAYNTDRLRLGVGRLSAIFMAIGLCCDIGVWYYVKGLRIYDDDDDGDADNGSDDEEVKTTVTNSSRNSLEMSQNGEDINYQTKHENSIVI